MSEQNYNLGHCFVCQNLMISTKNVETQLKRNLQRKNAEVGEINISRRIKKRTNQRSCKIPRRKSSTHV